MNIEIPSIHHGIDAFHMATTMSPVHTTLELATASSLNARHTHSPTNKKRKRDGCVQEDGHPRTFEAISLRPTTDPRSVTLEHVAIICRANVPLAWLNVSSSQGPLPTNSPFRAHIPEIPQEEQVVLIARIVPNGGLYAVERIESNIYISCPLQSWVKEQWMKKAMEGITPKVDLQLLLDSCQQPAREVREVIPQRNHTDAQQISIVGSSKKPKNCKGVLARMSILTPKDTGDLTEASVTSQSSLGRRDPIAESLMVPASASTVLPVTPAALIMAANPFDTQGLDSAVADTSSEIGPANTNIAAGTDTTIQVPENTTLDMVRQQYLETLYLNKTSLAFYAKGPLRRTRLQATSSDSQYSVEDLANFYRESLLPSKKIDVKYKDSLPDLVASLSPLPVHAGDVTLGFTKKKSKKKKMGKDCLWPGEAELIERWWRTREIKQTIFSAQSQANEVRNAISDVRIRESEMQILLMLEIMLLENYLAKSVKAPPVPRDPEVKLESVEDYTGTILAKAPQEKKKRDLTPELDMLVDRLCIWQTIGTEDLLASPDKVQEDAPTTRKSKDLLRDFCADIIVPFYSSKLPELCRSICKKLGGPEISFQHPKLSSSRAPSTSKIQPGAALRVRPRPTATRTLERVLSEDQSLRRASPPVLARSASISIPNLKREPSEVSQRPMSRGGLLKSVSFSSREIDLEADARVQETKRKKLSQLATQKRELEDAINALKKPNRGLAAKDFMDDVEKRKVEAAASLTGNKKMSEQLVHVTATPKKSKSRSEHPIPEVEFPALPNSVVPSSGIKPRSLAFASSIPKSSAQKRAVLSAIHETPSRGLSKTTNPLQLIHPHRPHTSSTTLVEATPSTSRIRTDLLNNADIEVTPLRMARSQRPVLFTSVRKNELDLEDVFKDAPIIPDKAGKAMDRVMGGNGKEMSIYDSLGWNDDNDL